MSYLSGSVFIKIEGKGGIYIYIVLYLYNVYYTINIHEVRKDLSKMSM